MRRFYSAISRISFLVGGGFLIVGIHRVIFGTRPKMIWDRDLPWDQVNSMWCFAATLALAVVGAWFGRRAISAFGDETSNAKEPAITARTPTINALESPAMESWVPPAERVVVDRPPRDRH